MHEWGLTQHARVSTYLEEPKKRLLNIEKGTWNIVRWRVVCDEVTSQYKESQSTSESINVFLQGLNEENDNSKLPHFPLLYMMQCVKWRAESANSGHHIGRLPL